MIPGDVPKIVVVPAGVVVIAFVTSDFFVVGFGFGPSNSNSISRGSGGSPGSGGSTVVLEVLPPLLIVVCPCSTSGASGASVGSGFSVVLLPVDFVVPVPGFEVVSSASNSTGSPAPNASVVPSMP